MGSFLLMGIGGKGGTAPPPPITAVLLADFSAEAGVYVDQGRTAALSSDPVWEWRSSVGVHVASQAVTAQRPTFRMGEIGGVSARKPVLHFSADDILYCDSLAAYFGGNDRAFSVILVIRWLALQDQDVLSAGVGETFFPLVSIRGGATSYGTSRTDTGNVNKSNTGGTSAYSTAGQGYLWTTTFDGASNNMWVNGAQVGAVNQNLDVGDLGTLTRAAIGGRRADAGDYKFADVMLSRLMIYDRALTTSERTSIELALWANYGMV